MTKPLVSVSRIIGADIAEVWAVTSSFGTIAAWMPVVTKVTQVGAGPGAVRMVTTPFGVSEEKLTLIDAENFSVRYSVNAPGMEALAGCVGGTTLTARGGMTQVDWVVEGDGGMQDLSSIEEPLKQFFESGLNGLAAFLKTSIE